MTILAVLTEMEGTGVAPAASVYDYRSELSPTGNDSAYSRGTIDLDQAWPGGTGTVLHYQETQATPAYDGGGVFWLHMSTYWNQIRDLTTVIAIADGNNDRIYSFTLTITTTTIQFKFWQYADGNAGTEIGTIDFIHWFEFDTTEDLDIKIDPNTDTVEVYRSGDLQGTLTSSDGIDLNTRTPGTLIERVVLRENIDTSLSQIILTEDEPTLYWKVRTLDPTGAGANSDWTGAYTDVDDVNLDTDSYNRIDSAGTQTYAFFDVSSGIQTDMEVAAIMASVLAKGQTGAAVTSITNVTRIGGVNYDMGSALNVEGGQYETTCDVLLTTSPATASAWTFAEINAAEFGFKSS